jgi:transcriptional regulator with XRE-family HTH domain
MKLVEPIVVTEQLMNRREWDTVEKVASNLNMSTNTVARALRGEPVRVKTIIAIASAINTRAADIAVMAQKTIKRKVAKRKKEASK